MLKQTDGAVWN